MALDRRTHSWIGELSKSIDYATAPAGAETRFLDEKSLVTVPDLFGNKLRVTERKALRGRSFALKCRWCGRRGYHLRSCIRAARNAAIALSAAAELELRWHYMLELARRELANAREVSM